MSLLGKALGNMVTNQLVGANPLFSQLTSGKMSTNTMLGMIKQQNPQQYQQIEQMIKGKSSQEINQMINNLCQEKGIDVNQVLQMLGKK